jgi:hypothetical protein
MKEKLFKFVDMVFVSIKLCAHLLIFPGYKSLHMLIFAGSLTLISLVGFLLEYFGDMPNFMSLVDWRGGLLATAILTVLYFIQKGGRSDDD